MERVAREHVARKGVGREHVARDIYVDSEVEMARAGKSCGQTFYIVI